MKLLKALSLVAVIGIASTAVAQEADSPTTETAKPLFGEVPTDVPQNIFSINPVGLLFGYISADYERALSPRMSAVISGRYFLLLGAVGVTAFGVGGGLHFFPESINTPLGALVGHAPAGWWYGPEAAIDFSSYIGGSWIDVTAGGLIGYNWAFGEKKQWVLSLGGGIGVHFSTGSYTTLYNPFYITGMSRGSIGYAF